MRIAAAYIRVSTDDQTEYSPDAQLRAIKSYCEKNNYFLDPKYIFIDEGKSGRKAEKRPAFMSMIGTAKQKPTPFEVILCHKFDRFARNREDSVVYKSLLRKECGISIISITESIENDRMSIIIESMLEAMAEYYSINLAEEVKKGMTEKARRGEPLSIPPFGYAMENKQLVINHSESSIVKKIFQDFISGKAYFAIASELNAMGIRTHRGNPFENRTVSYILQNPVYMGYIRWTPTGRTRRNFQNPDSMIIKSQHEPIIDPVTFEAASNRIKEIRLMHRPYQKPVLHESHWLRGLIRCPYCGHVLVCSNGYYICNGYVHTTCSHRNSIRVDKIEKLVLSIMEHDLQSTQFINIEHLSASHATQQLEEQLAELHLRLNRCKAAYEQGIDTIAEYAVNKKRITQEMDHIQQQKPIVLPTTCPNHVLDCMKEFMNPSADRYALAHKIIKEIIWDKDKKTANIIYFVQ